MKDEKITLSYGSGGETTRKFIAGAILSRFKNPILGEMTDSAVFNPDSKKRLAFTTDGYTVNPLFFKGGDIGKIAVCGTINDLTAMGAEPKYLSLAMIIEEGFDFASLGKILDSIKAECKKNNVWVVTGDTKVVEKNSCDGIFITTSGIGFLEPKADLGYGRIKTGDQIIVTGNLAEHGFSILLERNPHTLFHKIQSDCAGLWSLIGPLMKGRLARTIKFMRDPTRGGIAAVMNEVIEKNRAIGIRLFEKGLPIPPKVRALSEILGIDPLNVANEGKMVLFVSKTSSETVLSTLKKHPLGKNSRLIGEVTNSGKGQVLLETIYGALRRVPMPQADELPRIC